MPRVIYSHNSIHSHIHTRTYKAVEAGILRYIMIWFDPGGNNLIMTHLSIYQLISACFLYHTIPIWLTFLHQRAFLKDQYHENQQVLAAWRRPVRTPLTIGRVCTASPAPSLTQTLFSSKLAAQTSGDQLASWARADAGCLWCLFWSSLVTAKKTLKLCGGSTAEQSGEELCCGGSWMYQRMAQPDRG